MAYTGEYTSSMIMGDESHLLLSLTLPLFTEGCYYNDYNLFI